LRLDFGWSQSWSNGGANGNGGADSIEASNGGAEGGNATEVLLLTEVQFASDGGLEIVDLNLVVSFAQRKRVTLFRILLLGQRVKVDRA
jgi:hypothetical protein